LGAEGKGHGPFDGNVRGALKRQICYRYSSGMNILPAYVLTPELEDTVRSAIRQTSAGS
jgi:type III secretion protein V